MEIIKTKDGSIVKGNYGNAYSANGDFVKEARIKHGKPGRPATVPEVPVAFITNPMNDLFGRVPDVVVTSSTQGRVIIGVASDNGSDE